MKHIKSLNLSLNVNGYLLLSDSLLLSIILLTVERLAYEKKSFISGISFIKDLENPDPNIKTAFDIDIQ